MRVIDDLREFERPEYSVVTIGTFDGVHIGHKTILKKIVKEAKNHSGKSILITLWPHPRFILNKDAEKLKLLTTFDEKVELVAELGVDYIIKLAFTPEFSNLSAQEFVDDILLTGVGTRKLFIGYDHHFGNNREGNIDFLKKIAPHSGFEVEEILRQDIDDIGVSSTKIRDALHQGEIHLANSLLGRNYSIEGTVIHGNKRGRSIGFPTANIKVPEGYKLLPSDGSYVVRVQLRDTLFGGMLNIGFKPTVDGNTRTIEVHLFNFADEIYDESVKIEFIKALRKEMKFGSVEELRDQLEKDKINALKMLS